MRLRILWGILLNSLAYATQMPQGLYGGIGIGSMALDYRSIYTGIPLAIEHYGSSAVLGAVFTGVNHNWLPWFNLGVEPYYSFYELRHSQTAGAVELNSYYKTESNYGVKLIPGFNISPTARIFFDIAYTSAQFKFIASDIFVAHGAQANYRKSLSGFMYGGGIETALNPRITFRAEYQHINYANWPIAATFDATVPVNLLFRNQGNQFIGSVICYFDKPAQEK